MREATIAEEAASRSDYARLVMGLKEEEEAANLALLDSYEVLNEEQTRMDIERLAALEAREVQAKRTAAAEETEAAAGAFGNVRLRAGAGGISPALSFGIGGLGKALGPIMEAIFPIALIVLAIDLVKDYAGKIGDLINEMEGFGAAAVKAWDDANKAMERSRFQLIDYLADVHKIAEKRGISDKSAAALISGVSTPATQQADKEIARLRDENVRLSIVERSGSAAPSGLRDMATRVQAQSQNFTDWQVFTLAEAQKRLKDNEEEIVKLYQKKLQLQEAELSNHEKAAKKMRDEIHEFPLSIPWFLSGNGQRPLISRYEAAPTRPLGAMLQPRTSSSAPAISAGGGATAGGGGVTFSPVFAPVFTFHGVPADVQKFMRDQAEPILMKDFQGNVNQMMQRLKTILKNNGVQVNG